MNSRIVLSLAVLAALAAAPKAAEAAAYTVACGNGGPVSVVQTQLAAVTGTHNTLTVTGTCAGDLVVQSVDYLTIQGLYVTGSVTVVAATHVTFTGLTVYGTLQANDHASMLANNSTVNGYVQLMHESTGSFSNLTVTQWTDSTGTQGGAGVACLSSSECTFSSTTISGTGSGDPVSPSIGVQVASAARLNFLSGRITGLDWGVHVWNNATALFEPSCGNISIDSNRSIGVYVRDSGVVKLEGLTPDSVSSDCPGVVQIANNGLYGVRAEGGGNAYLYRAQISGHTVDGVRVQDGSSVKVRSSSIDAATTTGRSARVKSQAHLWFDEEAYGPTAGSTLAGPVCVTNGSGVDTDNSATTLTTVTGCTGP